MSCLDFLNRLFFPLIDHTCEKFGFTYFDFDRQRDMIKHFAQNLWPGGVLAIGEHEALPSESLQFEPIRGKLGIYHRYMANIDLLIILTY